MRERLVQRVNTREREQLQEAGEVAAQLGCRLFAAGGSVRDVMLARPIVDWDLVVEGDGLRFAETLAQRWNGRAICHDRFLTAYVRLPGGASFDVATAREETYRRPGALPQVTAASIEQDLWRRDFSVNAIAVALNPDEFGHTVDPTGGVVDIESRLIRALHEKSFWDDATRIVRAVGFEQRLGFALEPQTEQWLRGATRGGALRTVSSERLGEALLPLLENSIGPAVLRRAHELGAVEALGAQRLFTRRTLRALDEVPAALPALGEAGNPTYRAVACLTTMLLEQGATADRVSERLHLTRPIGRELRSAQRFIGYHAAGLRPARRPGDLWYQLHEASFGGIVGLWLACDETEHRQALVRYWRELRYAKLDIAAADLQAAGYRPGPSFGEAIHCAMRAKLNDGLGRLEQLALAEGLLNQTDRLHT